ncbi:hypothetical protein A2U01_0107883, partial [Trifolium medium]|nr:hypothetical protein [Trifolium medium]
MMVVSGGGFDFGVGGVSESDMMMLDDGYPNSDDDSER